MSPQTALSILESATMTHGGQIQMADRQNPAAEVKLWGLWAFFFSFLLRTRH
jgi:hypothetical protein